MLAKLQIATLTGLALLLTVASIQAAPIQFESQKIPFHLETDSSPGRNTPETMAGGVAVLDYNNDGRPDIFFTNGANIATLKKDSPKYSNHLFRNDGGGKFTDVTQAAGLAGTGYDLGVAVADYDNDGYPDIFVAGVHHSTLYHNNGNGTFTDVTVKAGLDHPIDPDYGPLMAVAAAWVDVNNDGLLDLFIVNYVQWSYSPESHCLIDGVSQYCNPRLYKGQPDQLYLNQGNGTFKDVSRQWGIRDQVGKGMSAGVADYDLDGLPDIFVANDASYNFLFHNEGGKFKEVALEAGVALVEDGNFVSGMGLDFRDFNNDGLPDIAFVALATQTFPLFQNSGGGTFQEVTTPSNMRNLSSGMSGFGAGLYDFDNDGWKDLFVSRGHVESTEVLGQAIDQPNTVFRNLGLTPPGASDKSGAKPTVKWQALTEEAGFTAVPPARHRGCAFGDFYGDGRVDIVVTGIDADAEIWINRTENSNHWLDVALRGTRSNRDGIGARIKVVTKTITQYNHMTTSVGYASSSDGPVHFGLGPDKRADLIEIHWPSGVIQTLNNVEADRILHVTEPAK